MTNRYIRSRARRALGDRSAELQMLELQRNRDAIRAQAIGNALSQLTGGVLGAMNQYESNQRYQQEQARVNELHGAKMASIGRANEEAILQNISPGLTGFADSAIRLQEPGLVGPAADGMGPEVPVERKEERAIQEMVGRMRQGGVGTQLSDEELRGRATQLYREQEGAARGEALKRIQSRAGETRRAIDPLLKGEVPGVLEYEGEWDVTDPDAIPDDLNWKSVSPHDVVRGGIKDSLLADPMIQGVLSPEEVDRLVEDLIAGESQLYDDAQRKAARDALLESERLEDRGLSRRKLESGLRLDSARADQARAAAEKARRVDPPEYRKSPDLQSQERDLGTLQKQLESALQIARFGSGKDRDAALREVNRLEGRIAQKINQVNALREREGWSPYAPDEAAPGEAAGTTAPTEEKKPGLIERGVNKLFGTGAEQQTPEQQEAALESEVRSLPVEQRQAVIAEAQRLIQAGVVDSEIAAVATALESVRSAAAASSVQGKRAGSASGLGRSF